MNALPTSLKNLIEELSRLPGIGPKSAQRLAFHLLKKGNDPTRRFAESLLKLHEGVERCERCFHLSEEKLCGVCQNSARDSRLLCIVETSLDLLAIEKTGEYRGLYHVLEGRLSPLDGIGPEQLRMGELYLRLTEENCLVEEIILALNPDLEGDTTALFLQRKLSQLRPLNVSRIARGIPTGGHVEYTDDATLIRALQGRQQMS